MRTQNSFGNRFQQLRWKMTLTYTAVTVGALLTMELIVLVLLGVGLTMLLNSGFLQAQLIQAAATDYGPSLRPHLAQSPPDLVGIADWLARAGNFSSVDVPLDFDATGEMFVVGSDTRLLAVRPVELLGSAEIGQPLDPIVISGLAAPLQAALAGTEQVDMLYTHAKPGERVIMAVPVWDSAHEQVLGVLVAMEQFPTLMTFVKDALPIVGSSLMFFTIIAGLAGTLYGYLAARGPVLRLNQLADATLAWSAGDFSITVDDPSGDELGQLTIRLNDMAGQLELLLETRRALAVVEERNRLARDLHDSAKQLAFAAAAQLNAARTSIPQDPQATEVYLTEAENLIKDLRSELTDLIEQLRPAAFEPEGLDAALREYTVRWSGQNDIAADVCIQGERPLPLDIEQTIFRIVQEALANVARHSSADCVKISLVYSDRNVACSIEDDGVGFDQETRQRGFGLLSMQERTAAVGGDFLLQSDPGKGTIIQVAIPLTTELVDIQEE